MDFKEEESRWIWGSSGRYSFPSMRVWRRSLQTFKKFTLKAQLRKQTLFQTESDGIYQT